MDDFQNRANMEYLPAIAHNLGFWFCFSSFLKTIRKKVVLALFVLLYKKSCVFKEYFFYFPAFKLTSWRNIFSSEGRRGGGILCTPFIWLKVFYFFAIKRLVKNDFNHLIFYFVRLYKHFFGRSSHQTFAKIHSLVFSILFLAKLSRNTKVY